MRGFISRLRRAYHVLQGDPATPPLPHDLEPSVAKTIALVRPFTLTSPERVNAVCSAIEYVTKHGIPGALVECGVWRGGIMMAAALTLLRAGVRDRDLYLFDTYEGMTEPTAHDKWNGKLATDIWRAEAGDAPISEWCRAGFDDVAKNMRSTGYPTERVHLVKGRVEDTLPAQGPAQIAMLRLDTDWYESTKHELEHLFPRLVPGGVLILDDYGHWEGARRAVDEYLASSKVPILLSRTDYAGRIGVRPW